MATVVSMDDCQKAVVSLLQASATAYGAGATGDAPDGTNRQYASATEIDDAILYADAEICDIIINTPGHPFQTTFIQTSSILGRVNSLPTRNGMIIRVDGLTGTVQTVVSMDSSAETVEVTNHGLATGDVIQFVTSGTVGGGLSQNTDYYVIYVDANNFQVASTYANAITGSPINLSATAPVNTSVLEYSPALKASSEYEVLEVQQYADVFQNPSTAYYFIKGDMLYLTSQQGRIIYTDYTKTTSPQSPEPYRNAIVAGAISKLWKDGSDGEQMSYWTAQYQGYLQAIAGGARLVPEIQV